MRVPRFPPDLGAVLVFTLFAPIAVFLPVLRESAVRLIIGIPFVLFVPGYALVSALYPARNKSGRRNTMADQKEMGITTVERTALSFVFSMAVVSICGLALNNTPFGLRRRPILIALSGVIIILTLIAYQRRRNLTPENRFTVPWQAKVQSVWTEILSPDSKTTAALNILVLSSLFFAVATTGYVLTTPTDGESYTEFYILTEEEEINVEDYPTEFVVGEPQSLVVGIGNQEYQTMNYTVFIDVHRVEVQDNSTEILATERLQSFETQIEHNKTWQRTHTVAPQMTGEQLRLTYTLYRGDPPASPTRENAYRELQLLVNVTA